jgi:hypothetical protein
MLIPAIAALIGAILYRLRGGLLNDIMGWGQKTQISRAVWSVPTAAFMWWAWGLPLWSIAALSVSLFASMALIGNGDYLDLKRKQPIIDLVGGLRNLIGVAPVAYLIPIPAAVYVVAGLTHAQLYAFSHRETGESRLAELLVGGTTWVVIATLMQMMKGLS